jgi:crotonobetainyl-CoA:carnitine CoA-transferase CaiB-like acyl-CoA transferase
LAAPKPLAGIRVVDFTRLLPGDYCTWLLATLGADVIKVEDPGRGDYQRDFGLPGGPRGSAVYQLVNQGKRSMVLDMKSPAAKPVLEALLDSADVVVESFRPGVAKRLGIDFEALRRARPQLVCQSINGYGSNSPLRLTAAHDINYLAFSGLTNRLVQAGERIPEMPLVDLIGGGLLPAMSILALLFRSRTAGSGGVADTALADAFPLMPWEILAGAMLGAPEPPMGETFFSGAAPNYEVYALRDGHVAVGAVEDQFWRELLRRLGIDFVPSDAPPDQLAAVKARLTSVFAGMTRAEVASRFAGADACVTVVQSYAEMLASGHADARQYTRSPAAPGAMPQLGSPFFHDGAREFARGVAPLQGEHTTAVLADLGFDGPAIAALLAAGAVVQRQDTTA